MHVEPLLPSTDDHAKRLIIHPCKLVVRTPLYSMKRLSWHS